MRNIQFHEVSIVVAACRGIKVVRLLAYAKNQISKLAPRNVAYAIKRLLTSLCGVGRVCEATPTPTIPYVNRYSAIYS